jgi:hypothetical protein
LADFAKDSIWERLAMQASTSSLSVLLNAAQADSQLVFDTTAIPDPSER